ncbi:hypothetical protein NCS52_00396500 [Fusarium sp. LHS14.1]|nr:hypothetical protein NCS52_00396500 [Fusarium sp. LHS14.1]
MNALDGMGDDVWYHNISEKLLFALHKACCRLTSPTSVQGLLKIISPILEPLLVHEKHRPKWACREVTSHADVMLRIAEYLLPPST